jgi:hypothetical protein
MAARRGNLRSKLERLLREVQEVAPAPGPAVVLPPVEVFRTLPPDEQYRLLRDYRRRPRPPAREPIDLVAFERLSLEERLRVMREAAGPPDENMMACFDCLTTEERIRLLRDPTAHSGGPAGRGP